MSPLSAPPRDGNKLRRFPRRTLRPDRRLYRIHRAHHSPWWFGSSGDSRFDLVRDVARGTCYAAEKDLGAFVEVFRDLAVVDEADVSARRLAVIRAPRSVVLADCTSPRARQFGVTAAIHATEDYKRTQTWARAFAAAGFDGVRYLVSHDPSQTLVGIALFGDRGEGSWPIVQTVRIPESLLNAARRTFGIRVLPAPP